MNAMNKFRAVFGKSHVVLPVIHVRDFEETSRNIEIVKQCNADGVWLISHGELRDEEMLEWQQGLIEEFQWDRIGLNLLSFDPVEAFEAVDGTGLGLWVDNAGILDNSQTEAERIQPYRDLLAEGLYFGGVAFKYQPPVRDLSATTRLAQDFVDVITTSGTGTGKAADVAKIAQMRDAAPEAPLAIASGITPENVLEYLPYTNAFLVATGISITGDFFNIDQDKLQRLVDTVNNYQ